MPLPDLALTRTLLLPQSGSRSGRLTAVKIERLLILEWFDGPVEAIARTDSGGSLLPRLRDEVPIRPESVYEVRRLDDAAYEVAFAATASAFGPTTEPVWIVPFHEDTELEATRHARAVLDAAVSPADELVATCTSADLRGNELILAWQ